jgi:chemotaxis-related protein WspD
MSAVPARPETCWNVIGVLGGDHSCPELRVHDHCRNCPVIAEAARGFFDRAPPRDYLAERHDLLARPPEDQKRAVETLLTFRIGAEWWALPTRVLVEVLPPAPVHRVPHRTNASFAGLVAIRGQLQLCVSLHGILGIEATAAQDVRHRRFVVVEDRGERWVFLADEVKGIEQVLKSDLGNVPGTLANATRSHALAVFTHAGRTVGLLDPDRLFAAMRRLGT